MNKMQEIVKKDREEKIKESLLQNPKSYNDLFEDVKDYMSKPTFNTLTKEMEKEAKIKRVYTPGEKGFKYSLVEKDYLAYTVFAQELIQYAHSEAMNQLDIKDQYSAANILEEVTHQYNKLLFFFFAAFSYETAFHLSCLVLNEYRLFVKKYTHLDEAQKMIKLLNDKWASINNLSVEKLQTKLRNHEIRAAEQNLKKLEDYMEVLKSNYDEGYYSEDEYQQKEEQLNQLIKEQKGRVEELSNSINY